MRPARSRPTFYGDTYHRGYHEERGLWGRGSPRSRCVLKAIVSQERGRKKFFKGFLLKIEAEGKILKGFPL